MPRFWEIDFARGVAIIMMVLFHSLWDLNYFGIIHVSLYTGFLGVFQKATAGLFLLLVGVSLAVKYGARENIDYFEAVRGGAVVFSGGMLLTLATFIFYRDQFIYFGILHLIGVSRALAIPLLRKKYTNLVLGLAIIALPALLPLQYVQNTALVWLGLAVPSPTLDFFPVLPWFGVVLLGVFLGNTLYPAGTPKLTLTRPWTPATGFVELLGKNSLSVYFAHQLVLFPAAYAISVLM